MRALVDTAWLARQIEEGGRARLRVVDSRWYLDPARKGRDSFRAGHIPGAVFVDLESELAAPGGGRGRPTGRHPWPSEEQVAQVMGRLGVGPGVRVVAYDDASGSVAARLWYVLRAHGHDEVAVLDGGITKWVAEGRPLSTTEQPLPPSRFAGRLRAGFVVTKAEMVASHRERLVLDARVGERYRGETEPIDPRAGHVPGARNAPWTANLTDERGALVPGAGRAAPALRGARCRRADAGRVLRLGRERLPRPARAAPRRAPRRALRRLLERVVVRPLAPGRRG